MRPARGFRVRGAIGAALVLSLSVPMGTAGADTGDVIDGWMYGMGEVWCPGVAGAVWTDLNPDDEEAWDTQLVFATISGWARVDNEFVGGSEKRYFFTPSLVPCDGSPAPWPVGKFTVRFVDILDPGFVWNDPDTWVYRTVPALTIRASHDLSVGTGVEFAAAYQMVHAYTGFEQDGAVAPAFTDSDGGWTTYGFSDPDGIKELYIRSDWSENNLDDLIIYPEGLPGMPVQERGVALLFDTSGSMKLIHDGTSTVPETERRLSLAKNAAFPFVEMLNDFGADEVSFGIARFPYQPWSGDMCYPEVISPMTLIDDASALEAIDTTIPGLTTAGTTPLLNGLREALGMFDDETSRAVVLLSDGYQNCPRMMEVDDPEVTALIGEAQSSGTRIYTIGFGRHADVDSPLLDELATGTDGTFHPVTTEDFDVDAWDPATALDAAFAKILADSLDLETGADPLGVIEGGETVTHAFPVNAHDRTVSFHVSWAPGSGDGLDVVVRASDGLAIPRVHPGVRIHGGPTYKVITVKRAFLSKVNKVGSTPWALEITSKGAEPVHYQYSIILASDIKLRASFDRRAHFTGDEMLLSVALTRDGMPMVGLREVVGEFSKPSGSLGNWFAQHKVTRDELAGVVGNGDESISDLGRKLRFLKGSRGIAPPVRVAPAGLVLSDDGRNGDRAARDGVYTARIGTDVDGTYSVRVRVKGSTPDGQGFQREAQLTRHVPAGVDPDKTTVDIVRLASDDKQVRLDLVITPMDARGNHVGPRYGGTIEVDVDWGRVIGPARDNLDGTYTQTVVVPRKMGSEATFSVRMRGEEVASVTWQGELPRRSGFGALTWVFGGLALLLLVLLVVSRRHVGPHPVPA